MPSSPKPWRIFRCSCTTGPFTWRDLGFTGSASGGVAAYSDQTVRGYYGHDGAFLGAGGGGPPGTGPEFASSPARLGHDDLLLGTWQQYPYVVNGVGPLVRMQLSGALEAHMPPRSPEPTSDWVASVGLAMPALHYESGRMVWLGDNFIASACIDDGRTEWVVRYDPPPGGGGMAVRALDDGSVLARAGRDFVRLSPTGEVVARRREEAYWVGFTEACGMLVQTAEWRGGAPAVETQGIERWEPEGLTTVMRRHLGDDPQAGSFGRAGMGSDCSAHVVRFNQALDPLGRQTFSLLGVGADGQRTWTIERYLGLGPRVPLADGGFLVMEEPTVLVARNADSSERWRTDLEGESWVGGALLVPDGVFYVLIHGAGGNYEFVAVDIGVGSAPLAYDGSGGNWARSNGPLRAD